MSMFLPDECISSTGTVWMWILREKADSNESNDWLMTSSPFSPGSQLSSLECLDLSNNNLSVVPKGLPRNLVLLHLEKNSIRSIPGDSLTSVRNLEYLVLHNNKLRSRSIHPAAFMVRFVFHFVFLHIFPWTAGLRAPFESCISIFFSTRAWKSCTRSTCTTTCLSGFPEVCLGEPRPSCYSTTSLPKLAAMTWLCSTPWRSSTSATTSWPAPGCTGRPSGSCACWKPWICQGTAFTRCLWVFLEACGSSRSRTTSWTPYRTGRWRAWRSWESLSWATTSWNWILSTREPGWSWVHSQWVGRGRTTQIR